MTEIKPGDIVRQPGDPSESRWLVTDGSSRAGQYDVQPNPDDAVSMAVAVPYADELCDDPYDIYRIFSPRIIVPLTWLELVDPGPEEPPERSLVMSKGPVIWENHSGHGRSEWWALNRGSGSQDRLPWGMLARTSTRLVTVDDARAAYIAGHNQAEWNPKDNIDDGFQAWLAHNEPEES